MDSLPREITEGSEFEFSHLLKKSVVVLKLPAPNVWEFYDDLVDIRWYGVSLFR